MKNRAEKTVLNVSAGILDELVAILCGLILPRLILTNFGSDYNGITSSITQFISCITLLKGGIGGVTRAALYKPLAEKDTESISAIVFQTERFMRRIALIFLGFVLVFAAIYPIWICTDFSWVFEFTLILIIAISTFVKYYFGLAYNMLLSADQRQCVIKFINSATTILNTIIAAVLINNGATIHWVKLGSSLVFALDPFIICWYAKRKYNLNKKVAPATDFIKQRWDAVGHEVAQFVNNNTDVMVITIFADIKEVSVYTVYHYAIASIRKVVTNFIIGFGAAFGNMYALKQYKVMHKNLKIYEVIVFSIASIVYSAALAIIVPFARVYTDGVTDVNYLRPVFGAVLTFAGAFTCFRIPYQTIVTAVGHYKQTRNGAFFEAGMNIVLSVILVIKFGIVGVAIGTLAAAIFRSCQYAFYLSKNILNRSNFIFLGHVFITVAIMVATYFLSRLYMPAAESFNSVKMWIMYAIPSTLIPFVLTAVTDLLFYREPTLGLFKKITHMFFHKKEKASHEEV